MCTEMLGNLQSMLMLSSESVQLSWSLSELMTGSDPVSEPFAELVQVEMTQFNLD